MARPQRPARDIDPPSPAHEWRGALWSPEQAPPGALASGPPSQDHALAYARDRRTVYRGEGEGAAGFRLLVEMGKDLTAVRALDALLELALQRATAFRGHTAVACCCCERLRGRWRCARPSASRRP